MPLNFLGLLNSLNANLNSLNESNGTLSIFCSSKVNKLPLSPTISRTIVIESSFLLVEDSFLQLDKNSKIQMDKTNVEIFFMMFDLVIKKQKNEFV